MKRYLIAIAILLSFKGAISQVPMWELPSTSIRAWYPFCGAGDLLDRNFGGFDLLSANTAGATDRFGHFNRAVAFNGFNSEMHYSAPFTIPAFGIADFTYSCHIYPTVNQDAIILYNGNPNLNGLGLIMNNGIFGGGAGNQVSMLFGGISQSTGFPVSLNQWHHILMRRNGNSYLLYVDGVQVLFYIPPVLPGYTPPTTVFQLGNDFTASARYFTGLMDDISIYERQVSNPEVLRIRDFDPFIGLNLGADTTICADTFFLLGGLSAYDTVLYPNNRYAFGLYDYMWSTGSDRTNSSIFFPSTETSDTLRSLSISRLHFCPTQDARRITHIVPKVNIGRDTIFCTGDFLLLNATPTPFSTFEWSTGAFTPSILVGVTDTYSIKVDSMGCVGRDTAIVIVSPLIHVSLTSDTTLCQGGTVTLRSTDPYVNPTYKWSDGITVSDTFLVTATGTYWLEVTDSACEASDTVRIKIVYDTLTVFNPDTAICKGAFIIVRATSSPDITYQWTPTSGIPVSNVPSTTITPDTSATYVLEGTIILAGELLNCHTRDTLRIDVQPNPQVDLGGNRNVCKYDSIRITPFVTDSWYTHYSYDWTPGTFLDDSTAPYVVFTAGDTTKLFLTVSTPAGCTHTDSVFIFTYGGDFAEMGLDTSLCPGDTVRLLPVSSAPGITTYVWHPATYLDDSTATNPLIRPINSIEYRGVATSQYGCKDTLRYSITVNPGAVVYLEDSAVLFPGESYQLSPSSNCAYYSWSPAYGINDTGISNPIAMPDISTKYTLIARTEDGCKTTDSIKIRVVSSSVISVPNAFAPGSVNSTLKVILRGIARLRYFRVYNRWGNLVFEGKNIETGWDGTFNDVPQPAGVYVYEAEAATSEGQIIRKQGNVTLLK